MKGEMNQWKLEFMLSDLNSYYYTQLNGGK